jgi:hypothetical protein
MMKLRGWVGLCAVAALSGCATGLVSSWKAPDAEALRMRGEKVAAVVMVEDPILRLAGEEALARELSLRGALGVPMYTLLPGPGLDEARARAAAEQAGIVGVVALRPVLVDKEISSRPGAYLGPMYAGFWGGYYGFGWGAPWSSLEVRTDTIIVIETLVYSLAQNRLVWGGQSKTTNPTSLDRLIRSTAAQVADELERQGLVEARSRG